MNLMLTFNRGKQCFNILLKLITMTYLKKLLKIHSNTLLIY